MPAAALLRQRGFARRARAVRLVLMDVDGVLTDGGLSFSDRGGETRRFDVKDGAGIAIARRLGLRTGLLSGKGGPGVIRRARDLGIEEVHLKVADKGRAYSGIVKRLGLEDRHVCYIGDDLVDLPVLERAGLPVAPSDAHEEVLGRVNFVTRARGGCGAVRETIDAIVHAQGRWPVVQAWFAGARP